MARVASVDLPRSICRVPYLDPAAEWMGQ